MLSVRIRTYFEKIREPPRSLRGLRWPEGNERFRGSLLQVQEALAMPSTLIILQYLLFERSEFLIDTSQKKNPSVRLCVRLILVLV